MLLNRENIDPRNPVRSQYVGLFEDSILVGNEERKILVYLPEGIRCATAGVIILPDNGISSLEMFERSSWKSIADAELDSINKPILMFLEAKENEWRIDEPIECEDGEIAYLRAAFDRFNKRDHWSVHEAKVYIVGYGTGGTIAQKAAINDPAYFTAVAAVDPEEISTEYLNEIGSQPCTRLDGFYDETGIGIKKGEVPVPAWILKNNCKSADYSKEIGYYKNALGTGQEQQYINLDTVFYLRTTETPYPLDQQKEAFRLWISDINNPKNDFGNNVNYRIWKEFFCKLRRWRGNPIGDLRLSERPIEDLKMDYYTAEVGGWLREWYVHVPKQVRDNPEVKVPLVFACHGYTCSGFTYTGDCQWHKVADKYGFIVIFPCACYTKRPNAVNLPAWNVYCDERFANESPYFLYMLQDIKQRWNIDNSRVYITGHSNGSAITHYMGLEHPELFAAIAPCSGVFLRDTVKMFPTLPFYNSHNPLPMPVWMFGGEREENVRPHIPEGENNTTFTLKAWLGFNQDYIPEKFEEHHVYKDRWHEYEMGKNAPVRYTWIENFPHAVTTEMAFRIWEEFFCHFSRNPDGTLNTT